MLDKYFSLEKIVLVKECAKNVLMANTFFILVTMPVDCLVEVERNLHSLWI